MRTRGDITALICNNKIYVQMLINMHSPPVEGNCCDENSNAEKPTIVEDHSMGCVDEGNNGKQLHHLPPQWKWTKKPSFYLLDLTVFRSYILFSYLL